MDRLFGILFINLSLLTGAIILQNVVLVLVVFVIGLALLIFGGRNKENEAEAEYSNEEIEKELEEFNK